MTGAAVFFLILGVFISVVALRGPSPRGAEGVFGVAVILGIFVWLPLGLLDQVHRRLELRDDGFSEHRLFRRRDHLWADFVGFRRTVTESKSVRHTTYRLVGAPGSPDVKLTLNSQLLSQPSAALFRKWVSARLPDLELADVEREADDRRERSLQPGVAGRPILSHRKARRIARATGWIPVAVGLLFLGAARFRPVPYSTGRLVLSIVVCLVLPAVVALKLWQPDAFQFGRFLGARLPASLFTAVFFGALAPAVTTFLFYRPLRWTSPLAGGLALAAVVGLPLYRFGLRRLDRTPGVFLGTAAAVLVYGYLAASTLNGALDRSRPELREASIADRRMTTGRNGRKSFTLVVETSGPEPVVRRVAVSQSEFDRARVGGSLGLLIGGGALGFPWVVGYVETPADRP